jgi:DNA modification methylase
MLHPETGAFCLRCGAWRGAFGLEPTPELFVAHAVEVFREVHRVLRPDGTLWLNLGDSYARDARKGQHKPGDCGKQGYIYDQGGGRASACVDLQSESRGSSDGKVGRGDRAPVRNGATGLKAKDLIGIPWMVAFALRADGWYLRQDIIWSKPNPMPESVTDRCTKSHEYLFLLTKSERYYYDADAIKEPAEYSGLTNQDESGFKNPQSFNGKHKDGYRSSPPREPSLKAATSPRHDGNQWNENNGRGFIRRNKRSVWNVSTNAYPDAHFATFPPALIEPCIRAGAPAGGTVLDPFGGAGTTALVADRLGRDSVLIELNPEYASRAGRRANADGGMFASVEVTHA